MLWSRWTYERDASRYGITLLHEVGVHDLDGWLSDFSACDRAYLEQFYRTGEKRPPMELWREGTAVLEPLPIPEFTPTGRGVVITAPGVQANPNRLRRPPATRACNSGDRCPSCRWIRVV